MAKHMDLYTDCPECDGVKDDLPCPRCDGSGITHVRVKALEWQPWSINVSHAGPFVICHRDDDVYVAGAYVSTGLGNSFTDLGSHPSLSAAKAACQAHHERMVMDMLEVVP